MSPPSIQFTLLHNTSVPKYANYADIPFKIYKEGDYYTIKMNDLGTCQTQEYMSRTQVFDYVRNFFHLIEDDKDPYESLQVTFPLLPRSLFPIPLTRTHREDIYESLSYVLDCWANMRVG